MADVKDSVKGGIDMAAGKAKEATDRVFQAKHDAAKEGQSVLDQLTDGTQHVAEKVGEYGEQVRDFTQHAAHRAQKWADETYDRTADTVRDFGNDVTTLVRHHPIPAVLIGFGIGLLIGRSAKML